MKVFKFGGASVSSPDRIRNVADILKSYVGEELLVVVSAMGKTTNALEKVVEFFFRGERDQALHLFETIKNEHTAVLIELNGEDKGELRDFHTEVEWLLHDRPVREFDYYYDQVVCVGELLSSAVLSAYLQKAGIPNRWLDVRDVIRTDNNYRDATIDWDVTLEKTSSVLQPMLKTSGLVVTQGFIASTEDNESTTLGREGSDYSAAVFANLLNAESQTIWKDVPGVMNADPKLYPAAAWIQELNYREVIEMAYYGAQVIHPKTIKPLQNKDIPLYVRSFIDPAGAGTCIHHKPLNHLPPIIVFKASQVLVECRTRDFSFVGEGPTAALYGIFEALKFKPNLTQTAAVSLLCVVDDHPEKVEGLALQASTFFDVTVTRGLRMLTIRHYTPEVVRELIPETHVILQQQTAETIQVLLRADL